MTARSLFSFFWRHWLWILWAAPALGSSSPEAERAHQCHVSIVRVRLNEFVTKSDQEFLDYLREVNRAPDTYMPLFGFLGDLDARFEELVLRRGIAFQRQAYEILKGQHRLRFVVERLKLTALPSNIDKALPHSLITPHVVPTTADRQHLDGLLEGTDHFATTISRRIRMVTAYHHRLTPRQKRTLALKLIAHFNRSAPFNFYYSPRFKPSDAGDEFLCSEGCAYVLVFAADSKVYSARFVGVQKNFDSNAWRSQLISIKEETP